MSRSTRRNAFDPAGCHRGTPGGSAWSEYLRLRRVRWRQRAALSGAGAAIIAAGVLMVSHRGHGPGEGHAAVLASIAGWPAMLMALALTAMLVWVLAGRSLIGRGSWGLPGPDIERWARGSEGEMLTAGILDGLPRRGWRVWHDLPIAASRANIDHLVVGRTGVWVVDTKSTRARVRSGWRSVRFGDHRLDTSPLEWEASRIEGLLFDQPGGYRRSCVRPVVAVHGSGLRRRTRARGVPVVPAVDLTRLMRRGRRRLSRRDMQRIVTAITASFGPPERSAHRG